jgi:hypothetical protein
MSLDSDVSNADSHLHVEFYVHEREPYKGQPFVKIVVPGDKTNVIDQPVKESHKQRFPRHWLYFQMQNDDAPAIGIPLSQWCSERPEEISDLQVAELQILKFKTVEQIAMASDSNIQRIGMGGSGLRERAKAFLNVKNQSENASELAKTRSELDELKKQMSLLMEARKPGRPRKETADVEYDAPTGDTGN